jgi:hypothetical protein
MGAVARARVRGLTALLGRDRILLDPDGGDTWHAELSIEPFGSAPGPCNPDRRRPATGRARSDRSGLVEMMRSTFLAGSVLLLAVAGCGATKTVTATSTATETQTRTVVRYRPKAPSPPQKTITKVLTRTTTQTVAHTTTRTVTSVSASTSPSAPTPTGCHPLTNSGNCYEPGEYCRNNDHGASGVAGDGEAITCEDNNGWRWEPT